MYLSDFATNGVSLSIALDCFAFGLSDQSRLKVLRRGKFEFRWTLEFIKAGAWQEDSTTGLLFFPFWEKEQIVYRQNRVIIGPRPEGLRLFRGSLKFLRSYLGLTDYFAVRGVNTLMVDLFPFGMVNFIIDHSVRGC